MKSKRSKRNLSNLLTVLIIFSLLGFSRLQQQTMLQTGQIPSSQAQVTRTVYMRIEFIHARMNPTNRVIAIDLFGNAMPKTVNNFVSLCDPDFKQLRNL